MRGRHRNTTDRHVAALLEWESRADEPARRADVRLQPELGEGRDCLIGSDRDQLTEKQNSQTKPGGSIAFICVETNHSCRWALWLHIAEVVADEAVCSGSRKLAE
jgi:hypothetical protein